MYLCNPIYKVSLDEKTLTLEQSLKCRNPECTNYEKVVETSSNPIQNVEFLGTNTTE